MKDERGSGGAVALAPSASTAAKRSASSPAAASTGSAHSTAAAAPIRLEPVTQQFIDSVADGQPLYTMEAKAGHQVLTDLQSKPVPLRPADIEDVVWPVGPTGSTRIRIVRPKGATEVLPLVMFFHGGGWVLGDKITHDRLVREIAEGVHACVVFVDYINSPEAKFPTQNEQAYASMLYAVERAKELRADASRLAIIGDSVGGNMSAAITLMAKERGGPKIAFQVLLYPLVEYTSEDGSYGRFSDGRWLTAKTMQWMFDLQGLDGTQDYHAYPLRATIEQLRGLPDALIITDDDILQDEGEEYAYKLGLAGVRVTTVRYNGTVHDFAMLNPLANTPAARGAIQQSIAALRSAVRPGA
ncbi:MAG: alpha/beta hydrolase [Gemmatimonadaceae bacterium]|nr:alpha/beta hydrolase [Gemmatimonadaceae bacterium]